MRPTEGPAGGTLALRALPLVLAATAALLLSQPSSASARTFVAGCGSTSFLEYMPSEWSPGCAGASPLVRPITWDVWGQSASGRGTALLNDCKAGCAQGTIHYYPATLLASAPRRCRSSKKGKRSKRRFFSQMVMTITYPVGNPFGEPAGPRSTIWPVTGRSCGK